MVRPTALILGESLVDYHGSESHVGGAPLHVAALLAELGWSSHFLTRIGDDGDGARITETLTRHEMDMSLVQIDPVEATGKAVVDDEDSGLVRFEISSPAAWDFISLPALIPAHDVLHFGTLANRSPVSRETIQEVVRQSTASLRTCDLNLRDPWVDDDIIEWALEEANILKMSSEELETVSADGPDALFRKHHQLQLIAVTSGASGATLIRRDSRVTREAPAVDIVDTVGAGDAFMAGLIDALFTGATDEIALEAASQSAARALSAPGALRP